MKRQDNEAIDPGNEPGLDYDSSADEDYPTGSKDNYEPDLESQVEAYAISSDRSKWALKYSIVWMQSGVDQHYYLFDYHPGCINAEIESDEITARDGDTPGEGEVNIYRVNADTGDLENVETITAYNPYETELAKTDYQHLQLVYGDGRWWVSGVDCTPPPAE